MLDIAPSQKFVILSERMRVEGSTHRFDMIRSDSAKIPRLHCISLGMTNGLVFLHDPDTQTSMGSGWVKTLLYGEYNRFFHIFMATCGIILKLR